MKKILFKTKKIYICNKLSSSSFEDEEVEGLKAEIDEGPLRVSEEAPKVRPHHTLPSSPIHPIKLLKPKINHQEEEEIIGFNYIFKLNFFFFFGSYLLDVGSYAFAVENIKEVKRFRCAGHGLHLHLHWHVCVLDQPLPFQHLSLSS